MKLLRSTPMSITTLRTTRKFITVFLNVNILSKYFEVDWWLFFENENERGD